MLRKEKLGLLTLLLLFTLNGAAVGLCPMTCSQLPRRAAATVQTNHSCHGSASDGLSAAATHSACSKALSLDLQNTSAGDPVAAPAQIARVPSISIDSSSSIASVRETVPPFLSRPLPLRI